MNPYLIFIILLKPPLSFPLFLISRDFILLFWRDFFLVFIFPELGLEINTSIRIFFNKWISYKPCIIIFYSNLAFFFISITSLLLWLLK